MSNSWFWYCEFEGFFLINFLSTVSLKFENGYVLTLNNVRYVPNLSYNLFSCTCLEYEGFEGKWGQGVMKICKGVLCLFKAVKKCNLYVYSAQSLACVNSLANVVKVDDKTMLWHNRLGHMSEKSLNILKKNELLPENEFSK